MSGSAEFATVSDTLWAKAIGAQILEWIKAQSPKQLECQIQSEALSLLTQIRDILNDKSLDDPECFYRIDALVNAFDAAGISTTRHDF